VYHRNVVETYMTLALLLEHVDALRNPMTDAAIHVPFEVVIECLGRVQPRYYSISSSPKLYPNHTHLTAVVLHHPVQTSAAHTKPRDFKGVATNYLLSMLHHNNNNSSHDIAQSMTSPPSYHLNQRLEDKQTMLPVFIRGSHFRLPADPMRPVIMVGPGTGAAPFRGFLQERLSQVRQGQRVGPIVLFFGCRHEHQDFLYKEEWQAMFAELQASDLVEHAEMIHAFSRDQHEKIYVQHRLEEHGARVWQWLNEQAGHFYVCGDAKNMARAIGHTLTDIAERQGELDKTMATKWMKDLRLSGRYEEDVWS